MNDPSSPPAVIDSTHAASPVPINGRARSASKGTGLWLIVLCFMGLTLPALLGWAKAGRDFDEVTYHFPTVQEIGRTWPQIAMNTACFSAVSPGYHYLLATIGRVTGDHLLTLRWLNWAIALGLPVGMYIGFCASLPPWRACGLLLPLTACNFFIKSACWVLPDDAGVMAMAFSLLGLMRLKDVEVPGWRTGALAALATAFRQLNVWLASALAARCSWWFFTVNREAPSRLSIGRRLAILLPSLIFGVILPMLVVLGLYLAWGGLVPMQWRVKNVSTGFSLASWVYVLSLLGLFGPFYLADMPWAEMWAVFRRPAAWMTMLLALGSSILTPTAPNMEAGRWGGYLWVAAQRLPVPHERALLFVLLAPVGAGVIVLFLVRIIRERTAAASLTWLVALVAWLSAMAANRQIFQRYYEPTLLVFLALGAACFQVNRKKPAAWSAGTVALWALSAYRS